MKRVIIVLVLWSGLLSAQSKMGALRLHVIDPSGLGVKTTVELVSEANQFRQSFTSDDSGTLDAERLPSGIYRLEINAAGFAPLSQTIEIRSGVPKDLTVKLNVAGASESVTVTDKDTLIDPERVGAVNEIGSETIANRESSLPGRSVQDLVNSQPGWLYEGNAVLTSSRLGVPDAVRGQRHSADGQPLAGQGPEIEADNVESMSVYTAGIPAEYGRKMGGIVEVNTAQRHTEGFHGQIVVSGGSFETSGGYTMLQYNVRVRICSA